MSEQLFTRLLDRSVLEISGKDARRFLQGLVSNDIEKVSEERAIYGAFLTAQGKYLHDFFITTIGSRLLLDCEASRIEDLYRRLKIYKLRSNVETIITDAYQVLALFGAGALTSLKLPEKAGAAKFFENGIVFTDPRLALAGARCILPNESIGKVISAGFSKASDDRYQRHRISLGLPDSSRDMEVEKSILLEGGFEELNGVDFKKGCYMGQELTARTKFRGLIKKRLMPVKIQGAKLSPGTVIKQNGKTVGELRSTSGDLGMAIIRLEALEKSDVLTASDTLVVPKKPKWVNF